MATNENYEEALRRVKEVQAILFAAMDDRVEGLSIVHDTLGNGG